MTAIAAIFGFPIGMILATFHLYVNLLLHCKFQFNSPCGLREVQNRFQDGGCGGRLGFPIDTILAHFDPEGPIATEQVSAQIDQSFGIRCQNLIFKTAAVAAILDF